jgi:hypothetical protein
LLLTAIVLSAIALLAAAGLRRKLLELEAYVKAGIGAALPSLVDASRLAGTRFTVVLKTDLYCSPCRTVLSGFRELPKSHPDYRFLLLVRTGAGSSTLIEFADSDVEVLQDDMLFDEVSTAWLPAILLVNPKGTIIDSAPVADSDGVSAFLNQNQGVA